MFCLFLSFEEGLKALPAFRSALVYSPGRASDPYLDDGVPPALVVQAYFDSLPELEAAAGNNSQLRCSAQAMSVRRFAVPDPELRTENYCTYLVTYEGPAQDEQAWHAHYLAHHPPLMAKLPGIRQLEVYLPMVWTCPSGWREERHMQRNKVAFDSAETLSVALNSPVRGEMRAGYAKLPRFSGRVTHYAMATRSLPS